jgi:DnaK suppressor protein
MDEKQTTHFREKLEKMSDDIQSGANKTISEMTDHSDNYPDPTDRAAAESDRSFELRIRDRERKLLNKIKEASERIDNGTFGICDECGDDIANERLEARPVTTYCIECKTRQEQEEKSKA